METGPTETPFEAQEQDLRSRVDALQHLVVSLLVLMLVVSGTLSIFMWRQWRTTSKDVTAMRTVINEFNRGPGARNDAIVSKLTEYGRTHPDFAPILARYGINVGTSIIAPAGAAPAGAPKK